LRKGWRHVAMGAPRLVFAALMAALVPTPAASKRWPMPNWPHSRMHWEDECSDLVFDTDETLFDQLGMHPSDVKYVGYLLWRGRGWEWMGTCFSGNGAAWQTHHRCSGYACGLVGLRVRHRIFIRFHRKGTRAHAMRERRSAIRQANALLR